MKKILSDYKACHFIISPLQVRILMTKFLKLPLITYDFTGALEGITVQ